MIPSLVFIGCPSLDTLIVDGAARQAAGGAAFISALAARAAGEEVGLVARVPTALAVPIAGAFGPGGLHRGGLVTSDAALPSFRIAYDADFRATYTGIDVGAEGALTAEDFPEAWLSRVRWVHIASIGGDADQQLRFATGLRDRGYRGQLSAGTYRRMVVAKPDVTRALLMRSDIFFLNEEEMSLLLPEGVPAAHSGIVCITRGADGVRIIGGPTAGEYPARDATVVDATGAGDAFCGGFLAGHLRGSDAVQTGLQMAETVLSGFGSTPLLDRVASQVGRRAETDPARIAVVAEQLQAVAQTATLTFTEPPHLPEAHPMALSMLWTATLHQFGFWEADATGWQRPMYGSIDGERYKGSDFIWAAFARAARHTPALLTAERMAQDPGAFAAICTADDGRCPIPDLASHAALHQAHGISMTRLGLGYGDLVAAANATERPAESLLAQLRQQPGYMGDPMLKKAHLLLIILANRPERFVDLRDPETIQPIVDYHMMRGCLRTGCVVVLDPDLERRLAARQWVDALEELAIRQATGRAIEALVELSGTSVAAVDGFFFVNGRRVCLETEPARCEDCPIESACAKSTALFQPVFRTTAY
jgi:sugar/nucleoside kinase (ribokinase family)